MSLEKEVDFDNQVLQNVNAWTGRVYDEIQASTDLSYESTEVEPLDESHRKEVGDYLREELGFGYASVMAILDGTKALYNKGDDSIVASYDILSTPFSSNKKAFLAHEKGHRLGRKIIENKLEPVEKSKPERHDRLVNYLESENFAERAKVAIGNSLGEDFQYDTELVESPSVVYTLRDRIGPEEFVDSERDETLPEMMKDIEGHIDELYKEEPSRT